MFPGLGHGPIRGAAHEDGSVHLSGTRDHVLHVVGVPGAIDVGIVARICLVLDVGGGDGDPTGLLLGGLVDGVVGTVLGLPFLSKDFGDGRRQSRLAVVDVANSTNIDVDFAVRERAGSRRV